MRPGPSDPDTIFVNLKRLGWSAGEYGTARGFTVELSRADRLIIATATTFLMAWQLAEQVAFGKDGGGYED
jgi:hypothetical protein